MNRKNLHRRGGALVETALLSPFLILLITGAAQVGAITFTQIQTDTAAREGARFAAREPNNSQAYSHGVACTNTSPTPTCASGYFTCPSGSTLTFCTNITTSSGFLLV